MKHLLQDIVIGMAAGAVATGPMTVAMVSIHRHLPPRERSPLPPRQIVENVGRFLGTRYRLDDRHRIVLSTLAHFAYGGAAGAIYAPIARKIKTPPIVGGIAYGILFWACNYLGLLPALRLYPSPAGDSSRRTGMIVVAHLIWGATLGAAVHLMQQPSNQD